MKAKLQACVRGELKWLPSPLTPLRPTLAGVPQSPTPDFQDVDLASIPYLVMMEEHGINSIPKGQPKGVDRCSEGSLSNP